MSKPRTMRRPLSPAAEKLLLTLFDGGKPNDMEAKRLLQRKNMLTIRDDGSIALTDLGKCSARTLLHERGYPQKRDVAAKLIAFALMLGLFCAPSVAKAACVQADIAGKWAWSFVGMNGMAARGINVSIDATGRITGGDWKGYDGLPNYFSLRSVELFRVNAACEVLGQFEVYYKPYETGTTYAIRGQMTRNKDVINDSPFVNPLGNVHGGALMIWTRK